MKLLVIAALAYFFCLQVIFPGYFHPLYPHHDDFYFPPGLSCDGHSLAEKWQWPRPLGFLATEVLGKLGLQGYLFVLVLVTLTNAALTMSLARRIFGQPISWFMALAYCVLLFAHPDFYVDYLHDAFGTLSYFYLILAMHAWYSYRETNQARWPVICAILLLAIGFTKETYFVSALVFWVIQIYLCRGAQRRMSVLMLAGSCLFFAAGLAANAYSMKTVLHLKTDVTSPYHVSFAPAAMVRGFWFYASRLFHPAVLVLALGGIAVLYRRREQMIMVGALVVAGVCALLPYSVLPNHLDSMYAWTGAALAFSPVLFFSRPFNRQEIWRTAAIYAGVAALAFLSIRTSMAQYEEHRWNIAQEKINRNIIDSYPALKGLDGSVRKVLVTGLDMPFHPFHTASYIRSEFGAAREWTVLIPEGAAAAKSYAPVRSCPPSSVRLIDYDVTFGFASDGGLLRKWSREQLHETSTREQMDRILFPALNPIFDALAKDPGNWEALLRGGVVYLKWGELDTAANYLERSAELSHHQNPYPMFFLGQVREAQGKFAEARGYYSAAVALDPGRTNPAFRAALERAREE
jgi:tetratricopeptide (TPR) repeat protein